MFDTSQRSRFGNIRKHQCSQNLHVAVRLEVAAMRFAVHVRKLCLFIQMLLNQRTVLFTRPQRIATILLIALACSVVALARTSAQSPPAEVLHTFSSASVGATPYAGMIQGKDGNFYGTTQFGGTYQCGTVFMVTPAGALTTLHSFDNSLDGGFPDGGVIQGSDGFLYGTTDERVFQISTDGKIYNTLHTFSDGSFPYSGVIQGKDGFLYGTTNGGGANGYGTVFRVSTDGQTFNIIHSFNSSDVLYLSPRLFQGVDGYLYGTTNGGGANGGGIVYQISTDGKTFNTLHSFSNSDPDGAYPSAGVIQGKDGFFYGTTTSGGVSGAGTVFRISSDGMTFSTLHSFNNTDGTSPNGVIQGGDGYLYGTTPYNWNSIFWGNGTVFQLSTDGSTFKTLHRFNLYDGSFPNTGMIQGKDGFLYGATRGGGANGYGTVFRVSTDGSNYSVFANFLDGSDALAPGNGSLVLGKDGIYYGVTQYGGDYGFGTLYCFDPATNLLTILHSFSYPDGYYPVGGLAQGKDGFLYGTTTFGGANNWGTVFKVSIDETSFNVLHSFNYSDGFSPFGSLIQGKDGFLYGTTFKGGMDDYGTVFQVSTDGKVFNTLHSFGFNGLNGVVPLGGVIQGKDGFLYGTTDGGGANGYGTVFQVSTDGQTFNIIHSFNYNSDGSSPSSSLIQGRDGLLYGTTSGGGANYYGTVFQVSTNGEIFNTLYVFNVSDGGVPDASLIEGSDSFLYGITQGGTVYRISTDGKTFNTLYSFSNSGPDEAGLIEGSDGNLYGTTSQSLDDFPFGTIYVIQTQLPIIKTISPISTNAAGPAFTLTLNGVNFTQNSAVNWTASTATTLLSTTFISTTELKAAVPAALIAKAGKAAITVVTGAGASNAENFTILVSTLKLISATLSKDSTTGAYTANITLQNSGYLTAPNVTIKKASLGAVGTGTTLPQSLGSLAAGASANAALNFSAAAGSSSQVVTLKVSGTFTGGSFSGSLKVTLP